MANIFHIDRPTNKITLGTDATTIVITPLTASKPLALNASKELESITIGTSLSYVRPTLNTIQDIRTTATPEWAGLTLTGNIIMPDGGSISVADLSPGIVFDNTDSELQLHGTVAVNTNIIALGNITLGSASYDYSRGINSLRRRLDVLTSYRGIDSIVEAYRATSNTVVTMDAIFGTTILTSSNTKNWTDALGLRAISARIETEDGSGAGTVTGAACFVTSANIENAGSQITNLYGLYVGTPTVGGDKVTNEYGIHIADQNTGLTLNYAIYTGAGLIHFGDSVGIGIATPPRKLTVIENDDDAILIRNNNGTDASTLSLGVNTTTGYTYIQSWDAAAGTTQPLTFWVGTTRKVTIATDGNVGINVTDPHSKLEVVGAISSATLTITTGTYDDLDVSGVNALFIDTSGGAVIIRGTLGGVNGQVLYIAVHDATGDTILHHEAEELEGDEQEFRLHAGVDETLNDLYGGWIFINMGGTHWHDCSHAKHVP